MAEVKMPKNSGKSPSFQFYYKDWLGDQRLSRASKKSKGVWVDLICYSMDFPIPGIFAEGIEGKTPLKLHEIKKLLTGNRKENESGINELIRRGIFRKNENGAFYIKRIYRDMKLRKIRQEAGKKGGNPNLLNQNGKQNPTPSTSTSTSIINTYTEQQFSDIGITVGLSEKDSIACYHYYNKKGWVDKDGNKITDPRSTLINWRINRPRFEGKNYGKREKPTTANRPDNKPFVR